MNYRKLALTLVMVAALPLLAAWSTEGDDPPYTAGPLLGGGAPPVIPGLAAPGPAPGVAPVAPVVSAPAPAASTAPSAPSGGQARIIATYTLPDLPLAAAQNAVLPGSIANDRKLLVGANGSDLWHGPNDGPNEYWMVTDRGPNGQIKVDNENRRTFPVPEFAPAILHVRVEGTAITILQMLPILGQSGTSVTGLSNLADRDEVPYDYSAKVKLPYNINGLDTEGIVRTATGDFWLIEEYGPSIVHVDAGGKVLKRYVPQGVAYTGTDYPTVGTLPAIYGKRKINRGFEGVTISPDNTTLYIVLQSPLSNPDAKTGNASRNTRILVWDIATERATAEYVYRFQPAADFGEKNTPDEMKSSAIAYVNATTLLVNERTDAIAKLYRVDLSAATNILGTKWDDPATAPTLESLADPAASGVNVLPKTLVADLSALPGIPMKVEGLTVLDKSTIAISNDNDSDIGDFDAAGNNIGAGVKSKIIVIGLPAPLP